MEEKPCALDELLLEQTLSFGTLPVGTARDCGRCAGQVVLRVSKIEGRAPVPNYANPDGTLRDDDCPARQARAVDMAFGDIMLGQAIRGEPLKPEEM